MTGNTPDAQTARGVLTGTTHVFYAYKELCLFKKFWYSQKDNLTLLKFTNNEKKDNKTRSICNKMFSQ